MFSLISLLLAARRQQTLPALLPATDTRAATTAEPAELPLAA